jgi:hypothetical protein
MLNGYPIFGGHWKFASVIRTHKIDEVVLCGESIKEESLRRVQATAAEHAVPIKQLRILFEDYHPGGKVFPVGHANMIVDHLQTASEPERVAPERLPQRLGGSKFKRMNSEFA